MCAAENKIGSPLGTTSRDEDRQTKIKSSLKAASYLPRKVDLSRDIADFPGGFEKFSEAVETLSHYFVMPPGQRGLSAKAVGCRVIMAMWVMRPDIIGNLSTTEIGALVDARPEVLSRQATAFSKRFGVRGRAQFTDATRKAQREAAEKRVQRQKGAVMHGLN